MKFNYKTLIIWAVLAVVMYIIFSIPQLALNSGVKEIDMVDFLNKVESGEVQEVEIDGVEYRGTLTSGDKFVAIGPSGEEVMKILAKNNVRAKYIKPEDNSFLQTILASWLPMIVLIVFFLFFMRQMQGGGNKAFSFGKSKHRMISKDKNPITFKDVAGVDEAKEELEEVVDFLKRPGQYTRMGAKIPHGVLLVGPPGTGKTLLAKAVAGEANVPFFTISGSDFVEMFVGVGASRVRDLFNQAKSSAPCIIFVDEIDAVGRQRGAGLGGGHDEREQTLNQLLVEMDGFGTDAGVIVMAATNRPDVLDPALLRPGRFDRQVHVPMPDIKGRQLILEVHAEKIRIDESVDFSTIARGTPGFSGADLANLLNEAALVSARMNKDVVTIDEIEEAKDKVLMGKERRSLVQSPEEKKATAYHEAGHTVVGFYEEHSDPVHKVSIIPRGRALGITQQLPDKDRFSHTKDELLSRIRVLMGGRCAEELFLGKVTTGAGNDIERASQLARNMVMHWGMSEKLGPINFGDREEQVFLGRELSHRSQISEYTSQIIDQEVQAIIMDANSSAIAMLEENKEKVEKLVELLVEKETLGKTEIESVLLDMPLAAPEDKCDDGDDQSSPSMVMEPEQV